MTGSTHVLRRGGVLIGVVAAIALGALSIRAAAAWTEASAPLTVAPVPVETLDSKVAEELARSEALREDLANLASETETLRAALDSADAQVGADTGTAAELEAKLAEAKARLADLEALVAKAERQLQATVAAAKARQAAPAPAAGGGEREHDDEHDDD
jgi:DNA repair exonuclease SbcCD ATPase subunit